MPILVEADSFKRAVDAMGGARAIDLAMEPLIEGLHLNPEGFDRFEHKLVSFRYARTKRLGSIIPALVVIFTIEADRTVVLQHVEEDPDAA